LRENTRRQCRTAKTVQSGEDYVGWCSVAEDEQSSEDRGKIVKALQRDEGRADQ
jgi:hypothetical protein